MSRNKSLEAHTVYVQRRQDEKVTHMARKVQRNAKANARKAFGGAL